MVGHSDIGLAQSARLPGWRPRQDSYRYLSVTLLFPSGPVPGIWRSQAQNDRIESVLGLFLFPTEPGLAVTKSLPLLALGAWARCTRLATHVWIVSWR